ncbi:MAG: sugar phosphate isomerase/epimerase [Armatimonadetes bacterium]|nr:sugar phosphate isomerase/epimerase [Armatimonadota bacterium]
MLSHLSALGIRLVEIGLPAPAEQAAMRERLARFGLRAATVMADCPVAQPDVAERFRSAVQGAVALGAGIIFVSVQAGDTPLATVYERLRAVGDVAAAGGVRVAMETHPDLCANGTQMAQTMTAIDHPAVGVNFDTANISYYNHDTDAVSELARALPWVVSVHLKDTMGGFQEHNFPTLGQGVVNFPALFERLGERDFRGPYTMELEGVAGEQLSAAQKAQRVSDSVAYLRTVRLVPRWA